MHNVDLERVLTGTPVRGHLIARKIDGIVASLEPLTR